MPRFAILQHDWPELHWDFLLEAGDVLRAWRLLSEPVPGAKIPAEANNDHRKLYLDFEGPLTGNRGSVTQWDAGTFEWITNTEEIVLEVKGRRLQGWVRIVTGHWSFSRESSLRDEREAPRARLEDPTRG